MVRQSKWWKNYTSNAGIISDKTLGMIVIDIIIVLVLVFVFVIVIV